MGCDIHLHIEIKMNDIWHHYHHPHIHRDYALFEKMAGVRGEVSNAISPPKGLPTDLSALTTYNFLRWDGDGHSHSWLSANEIVDLEDWLETQQGSYGQKDLEWDVLNCYLFGNSFAGFTRYPDNRPPNIQDVRFVFWFDN